MHATFSIPSRNIPASPAPGRLIELERIIEAGRKTFIEVGTALAEIRDARLYKAEHATFEVYCERKWGFKRSYAYQVIEPAAVALSVSAIADIQTESQARELARVPREKRAAVINSATMQAKAAGRKLTARDLRAASSAPESEPGPQRIPRSVMHSQNSAENWWYTTGKPGRRGLFLWWLVTTGRKVEVEDKGKFEKQVSVWLANFVSKKKRGSV